MGSDRRDQSRSSRRSQKRYYISRNSKGSSRTSKRSSRSSRKSSRGSRRSSRTSRRSYVKSSREVLKDLWSEYRALYQEKRANAHQKKTRGSYLEAALVGIQALSLTGLIFTVVFTAIKTSFQDEMLNIISRAFFELILTVVVVGTINRQRQAARSIVVSLYLVAVVADAFLLEQKMRGNWQFFCKKNDTNCIGFIGFRSSYMFNMMICATLHMFGALFATLAMNLQSQAEADSRGADYMRMAIKKNRKLRKRQRRQTKKLKKKQRNSIRVISSSEFSSMTSKTASSKSTRRNSKSSKRSSRRTPKASYGSV